MEAAKLQNSQKHGGLGVRYCFSGTKKERREEERQTERHREARVPAQPQGVPNDSCSFEDLLVLPGTKPCKILDIDEVSNGACACGQAYTYACVYTHACIHIHRNRKPVDRIYTDACLCVYASAYTTWHFQDLLPSAWSKSASSSPLQLSFPQSSLQLCRSLCP